MYVPRPENAGYVADELGNYRGGLYVECKCDFFTYAANELSYSRVDSTTKNICAMLPKHISFLLMALIGGQ